MSKFESMIVRVDALDANPWNPNKMQSRTFDAEVESIASFGFIDPITVREHPELKSRYQIIDGEHRWRAAKQLGLIEVPVSVVSVSDVEAKKLTIVLNETRGEADVMDLALLLKEISDDDDDLINSLPYSENELEDLLNIALLEIPDYDESSSEPDDEWVGVNIRLPKNAEPIWLQVKDIFADDGVKHSNTGVENGLILEALCAEFIAGRLGSQG